MTRSFGPVVIDGELQYGSPSSLELGGPTGCARSWYYRYVEGLKEPPKPSQVIGTATHGELYEYARTGVDVLGPIARRAKHLVPPPGPHLLLEFPIAEDLATAPVRLDGLPLVGYVDLAHDTRENRGGTDIEATVDPEGTVEVVDYKTASSDRFYKTGDELRRSIQMVTYGERFRLLGAAWLRLSHIYIRTDAPRPAVKRTILVGAQEIADRFGSFVPIVRLLREAAKAPDADAVPANLSACSSYGGCPHRSYCTAASTHSLSRLFGDDPTQHSKILGEKNMSLLSSLIKPPAATLAVDAPPPYPAGFAEACAALDAAPYGWPALGGPAAVAKAAVRGVPLSPGAGIGGSGQLGGKMISDPLEIVALGDELREAGHGPAADDASRARSAARKATPAPAAPPPPVAEVTPPTGVGVAVSLPALAPPDAPAPSPVAATPAAPVDAAAPAPAAPPAEKPKRGRKPKEAPAGAVTASTAISSGDGLEIYVDCTPLHGAPSLWPVIDQWVAELVEAANKGVDSSRQIADIRSASGEHPYSFGKWRGILGAYVKEQAAALSGAFTLDTRGSEIGDVVAEALRSRADLYVRGIR